MDGNPADIFGDRRFSVSELTELIKTCLEGTFRRVTVEGEVSNWRPSSTGHLYFTLKDQGASISAVMFRNRGRGLGFGFEPRDGVKVRVSGALSVYALRGSYQIVVDSIEQAGAGDILLELEERKRRLAAEGLFDQSRKKPLPRFPERVGIVTSPTGAALRDILNILRRRAPGIEAIVLPCPVQGEGAAKRIANRIVQANRWRLADVLIVGRGGGSLEDLLPFSDEAVVRAVAASAIPVVSAVGHEIDWAICDFAADLRAPTPSAAAELVSADRKEALARIRGISDALQAAIRSRLDRSQLALRPFSAEEIEYRFRTLLQPRLVRFDDAKEALCDALDERLAGTRERLRLALGRLEAANPREVLARGFSIVTDARTGRVIRDARELTPNDSIIIRPERGLVAARVESVAAEERA